jgi:uncharacterized RDD family membrane protein YckC
MSTPDSYDVDDDEQMTGEAVGLDLRPTGFVLNAAGAIIDALLSIAVVIGASYVLALPAIRAAFDDASFAAVSVVVTVFALIGVPTIVETVFRGKSLGKLAVGARIVRDDGGAIGFRHAFIRALTGLVEIYGSLGGIAALTAIFNPRSKRLGDYLAGTYSQHERVPQLVDRTFGVPPGLAGWARTADVARMPDPLARRIAQFLAQATGITPDVRARIAAGLAAEAAHFVSPLPAADAELFLAALTVVRREREGRALELERERLAPLAPLLTGLPNGFPERG